MSSGTTACCFLAQLFRHGLMLSAASDGSAVRLFFMERCCVSSTLIGTWCAGPGMPTRPVVTEGAGQGVAPGTPRPYPCRLRTQTLNAQPMSDEPGTPSPSSSTAGSRAAAPAGSGHTTAAVIPAAGRGVRLGPGAPKALRTLNGTPMLVHAVRAMAGSRAVSLVVVVAPPDGAAEVEALLNGHSCPRAPNSWSYPAVTPARSPSASGSAYSPRASPRCWCTTRPARWCPSTPWTR